MINDVTLEDVHTHTDTLQNKIGLNYIKNVVVLESVKINEVDSKDSNKVQRCA